MTPEENFFKFALTHPHLSGFRFSESKIENQEIVGVVISENSASSEILESTLAEVINNDRNGKTMALLSTYLDLESYFGDIVLDYSKQQNPDYPTQCISDFLENLMDMSDINKLKYMEKILLVPLLDKNIDAQNIYIYIKTLANYKFSFLTREIII